MRLIVALLVAIAAVFGALGNSAAAGGGPTSPQCGSPLGGGHHLISRPAASYPDGTPYYGDVSDLAGTDLRHRGIDIARTQYTNPVGWPFSAPILSFVSGDRSLLVFRFDCPGGIYSTPQFSGWTTYGTTLVPIDPELMAADISPSGKWMVVELGFDTSRTAMIQIDLIGFEFSKDPTHEVGDPFVVETVTITLQSQKTN